MAAELDPYNDNTSRPSRDGVSSPTIATAVNSANNIAPYTVGLHGVRIQADFTIQAVLLGTLGLCGMVIVIFRLQQLISAHIRHMLAMRADAHQQVYFARNQSSWWPKLKSHIIYAPIGKKRHSQNFQFLSISVGNLPTRLQSVLICLYILSNFAYCAMLDYGVASRYAVLAELRGRSGILAVTNTIPLVLFAGRNNPLIPWLKISFDTYNLLHRWIGRVIVIQSIIHTASWAVSQAASLRWDHILIDLTEPFMTWGGIAVAAAALLAILSPGFIRHAFYETFLTIHNILAVVFLLGLYLHCNIPHLPAAPYVMAAAAIWTTERFLRIVWVIRHSFTIRGLTEAYVSTLPGDACRVTLHLPGCVKIRPGMHAYLRLPQLNIWESHPFSIAYAEERMGVTEPTLSQLETGALGRPGTNRQGGCGVTEVSFLIHAKAGFTRKLLNFAQQKESTGGGPSRIKAFLEGPYGGHQSLDSYGHVVLLAGSSGITHQLSYVRHLLKGYEDGTVATRRVVLLWVIRRADHFQWAATWLGPLLRMSKDVHVFDLRVFITQDGGNVTENLAEPEVGVFWGRPDVSAILSKEMNQQIGSMCVTVCGPGGLADDARQAVRNVQEIGHVDFVEESFSW
ncbi:hypothetical protein HIM_05202 [Hirsutella minnesotensis 3608]|uniref:FAD-binding FR-type domain-containing protein n=1 Tax=Hirsutella minnesotensis 3608 TaxID=1043627 RepID=A0A0F7ZKI4_9HYPO|nr:hypothetical protein HIM_05202 [Hirsutella minnesotensis 3608]